MHIFNPQTVSWLQVVHLHAFNAHTSPLYNHRLSPLTHIQLKVAFYNFAWISIVYLCMLRYMFQLSQVRMPTLHTDLCHKSLPTTPLLLHYSTRCFVAPNVTSAQTTLKWFHSTPTHISTQTMWVVFPKFENPHIHEYIKYHCKQVWYNKSTKPQMFINY